MDEKTSPNFPFEILDVGPEVTAERKKHFNDGDLRFVRVGPKGYFLPEKYRREAQSIYTMPLRSTDVFVTSYPRSGTTWSQELVWLVINDFDYQKSKQTPLTGRYAFLEYCTFFTPTKESQLMGENANSEAKSKLLKEVLKSGVEILAETPSPRFIKSHLPLSLLPRSLLDTAKMVYIAREPKDVAVSYYHFSKNLSSKDALYFGDFKAFWNYLITDAHPWSPYFEHVKEAWQMRHHPNMLFLFYEELCKDLPAVVRRVAEFFKKQVTTEQISQLCDHLRIDNFKKNESVGVESLRAAGAMLPTKDAFIRKGKTGGWRGYFDEDMTREAERWIEENLRGTDLCFPTQ